MEENIQIVEKLILSQEDHKTHKSLREIEMDTGIPKSTVNRIVKRDLHFYNDLQCENWQKHFLLVKMLPEMHVLSGGDFNSQQDGAKCHTARATIAYIREHTPYFIKPLDWPQTPAT